MNYYNEQESLNQNMSEAQKVAYYHNMMNLHPNQADYFLIRKRQAIKSFMEEDVRPSQQLLVSSFSFRRR